MFHLLFSEERGAGVAAGDGDDRGSGGQNREMAARTCQHTCSRAGQAVSVLTTVRRTAFQHIVGLG